MKKFLKRINIPSSRLLTLSALIIVVYSGFVLSKVTWENYKINQHIKSLQKNIIEAEDENLELKNEILYYQTKSYKEKEARDKLSLQKEGEIAIVITNSSSDKIIIEKNDQKEQQKQIPGKSNYEKWWDYFFKD